MSLERERVDILSYSPWLERQGLAPKPELPSIDNDRRGFFLSGYILGMLSGIVCVGIVLIAYFDLWM